MARASVALVAFLLAGCLAHGPPDDGPHAGPAAAPLPRAAAEADDVDADGVPALLWEPASWRTAVVLVAGRSQSRDEWRPFGAALFAAGFRALALDGPSNEETAAAEAGVQASRAAGAASVTVVGASRGANAAMLLAAGDACVAVAQISPVPSEAELVAFHAYGPRHLFLGAAPLDGAAFATAQHHQATAVGEVTYAEGDGGAHGIALLEQGPVAAALTAWLGKPAASC